MLVDRGVRLVVSGPWPQESQAVADELRSRGGEVVVAPGDVTDAGQVEGLAQVAVDTFGSLDLWVNNAAAATPVGLAFDLSPETFQRSIDVNVRGTYLGARAAAGRMLPARRGGIVNMLGRGDDVRPTPHTSPYGASKAWVRAFTRTLQAEYQDSGVHVVGFNPGMMLTDMLLAPQVVASRAAAEALRHDHPDSPTSGGGGVPPGRGARARHSAQEREAARSDRCGQARPARGCAR
jgi:NAD(P)-dependent dehydrogenase (short-subunit alcohol dehydrogenase family)